MAEGADLATWDHTASITVTLANCHRDSTKKKQPYELADFHPYRTAEPKSNGLKICQNNKALLKKVVQAHMRRRARNAKPKTSQS